MSTGFAKQRIDLPMALDLFKLGPGHLPRVYVAVLAGQCAIPARELVEENIAHSDKIVGSRTI